MANGDKNDITYFAEANFRNEKKKFGIKRLDRTKHTYIIGKTGMGKTTLLENMAAQDIFNGEGMGIVDPHGDFAEKMLKFVPPERVKDVIYFAPHDMDYPIAFNVMENVDPARRYLVANGLMGVFKKIWPDVWSARMEYILNNCILALLEYPNSTLLGVNRMLSDKTFRNDVIANVKDPAVKAFWTEEFAKYTDKFMTEAGAAIQNKVGQFISNPLVRNIIGQPHSSFDIREVMDGRKILIMNLSKGRIGEENSRLIGAMLITKIYLAAMSRVNIADQERKDFYLYVDEFQNFATESFKDILSEARKYRLNLVLAHQYIAQMDETVRDAVIGNVGTIISFRVGAFDAELLEKEFAPDFVIEDIVNLGFASIYLKLMIDGVASRPFSATTLPPIMPKGESNVDEIIKFSRDKYGKSREDVENNILEWHKQIMAGEAIKSAKPAGPSAGGAAGARASVSSAGSSAGAGNRDYTRSDEGGGGRERGESEGPEMFEAVCAVCGKRTYVPFQPDGVRPVLCKTHRKQPAQLAQQTQPVKEEIKRPVDPASVTPRQEKPTPAYSSAPVPRSEPVTAPMPKPAPVPAPINRLVAPQPLQTISLRDLGSKKPAGASLKSNSNSDALKKIISEVTGAEKKEKEIKKEEKIEAKKVEEVKEPIKNILKPGDKIKF